MKTISIAVYEVDELSDAALERAYDEYRDSVDYTHEGQEAIKTLEKLAEWFGGKLKDWSIAWDGSDRSWAKFDMPEDMSKEEIHERLNELGRYDKKTLRGLGDCRLTGVWIDEEAIDGFRKAFITDGKTDLTTLMNAAFISLLRACQRDLIHKMSMDYFMEESRLNGWIYLENGRTTLHLSSTEFANC